MMTCGNMYRRWPAKLFPEFRTEWLKLMADMADIRELAPPEQAGEIERATALRDESDAIFEAVIKTIP